jgi:hypothetical protein
MIPEMRKKGISGPCFISIGDAEKIKLFLENNPKVPRELMLVDGYNFDAYNAMGYGRIAENKDLAIKGTMNMKAPSMDFGKWFKYLSTVAKLAPVPEGSISFPEGVTRLGGTLAVNGEEILYSYEDGVPGDHPQPSEVLSAFK